MFLSLPYQFAFFCQFGNIILGLGDHAFGMMLGIGNDLIFFGQDFLGLFQFGRHGFFQIVDDLKDFFFFDHLLIGKRHLRGVHYQTFQIF